jgi:hypothetical protein
MRKLYNLFIIFISHPGDFFVHLNFIQINICQKYLETTVASWASSTLVGYRGLSLTYFSTGLAQNHGSLRRSSLCFARSLKLCHGGCDGGRSSRRRIPDSLLPPPPQEWEQASMVPTGEALSCDRPEDAPQRSSGDHRQHAPHPHQQPLRRHRVRGICVDFLLCSPPCISGKVVDVVCCNCSSLGCRFWGRPSS